MDLSLIVDIIISLVTLAVLEVVLGIDNLVFISIVTKRLPSHQQKQARRVGLMLAWVTRLMLLASVVWIAKLTTPLFSILEQPFSWRDLFLISGGLFLLVKATTEIHAQFNEIALPSSPKQYGKFKWVVFQVAIFDIIFSLDSILTAIGLTQNFWVMAAAITIAILAMIFASEPLAALIDAYPTIKMLALSFLILIGMVLIADGFEFHIPRGYVYFAVSFSIFVECLNSMLRKKKESKSNS